MKLSFFLIVLSAMAFAISFYVPFYSAWLVFIFLIPLYYSGFKYPLALKASHGFIWGIIFFNAHLYGIIRLLFEHGNGIIKYFLMILLIAYCALYSALWFLMPTFLIKKQNASNIKIGIYWIISTFTFFTIITHHSLWIVGLYNNGNCFASPLLPLAAYPFFLRMLPFLGNTVLLLLLIMSQLIFAYGLAYRNRKGFLGLLFLLPFFYGLFIPFYCCDKNTITELAYIKPCHYLDILDQACNIDYCVSALIKINPQLKYILMPESSLCISLNMYPTLIQALSQSSRVADVSLLIGAYRREEDQRFNSLYVIQNGKIKTYYDKRMCMPFMEYIPKGWHYIRSIKNLFLKNDDGFSVAAAKKSDNVLPFVSYICSEFFFVEQFDTKKTILVLINDAWFSALYFKDLMVLYARYKAIELQRDIIYVGHDVCYCIDKSGMCHDVLHVEEQ